MFDMELFQKATVKIPERYLLVNMVTIRTKQITNGADPLVDPEDLKPVDIALKEISEGMIIPHKEDILLSGDDLLSGNDSLSDNDSEDISDE